MFASQFPAEEGPRPEILAAMDSAFSPFFSFRFS
jgi:hypothetical protein